VYYSFFKLFAKSSNLHLVLEGKQ